MASTQAALSGKSPGSAVDPRDSVGAPCMVRPHPHHPISWRNRRREEPLVVFMVVLALWLSVFETSAKQKWMNYEFASLKCQPVISAQGTRMFENRTKSEAPRYQTNSNDRNMGERENGGRSSMPSGENLPVAHDCGLVGSGGFCLELWISSLFRFWILGFRISCLGCGYRPREGRDRCHERLGELAFMRPTRGRPIFLTKFCTPMSWPLTGRAANRFVVPRRETYRIAPRRRAPLSSRHRALWSGPVATPGCRIRFATRAMKRIHR